MNKNKCFYIFLIVTLKRDKVTKFLFGNVGKILILIDGTANVDTCTF